MIEIDWEFFSILGFFMISTIFYTKKALPYLENRKNLVEIDDPLYSIFTPMKDTSNEIFLIETLANMFWIYDIIFHEKISAKLLFMSYICFIYIRILCLWLCPLKISQDHYVLKDPVQEWIKRNFGNRNDDPFVNDLFFSGHISLWTFRCFTWYYISSNIKFFFGILGTILVMIFMLYGRFHYTIDLVVAPFINICILFFFHSF